LFHNPHVSTEVQHFYGKSHKKFWGGTHALLHVCTPSASQLFPRLEIPGTRLDFTEITRSHHYRCQVSSTIFWWAKADDINIRRFSWHQRTQTVEIDRRL